MGSILSAVGLSLICAAAAVALGVLPALGLAWVLARKHFPGKIVIESLVMLPLVVPPVVTGYLLLLLLGRRGLLGPLFDFLHLPIAFTWRGAAVAQAVIALPIIVLALRVAFEAIDPDLEQAAATEGASPTRIFWSLTLPMSWPALAAGCALGFARALGEFGATILIAGNIEGSTRTLPLAIYSATYRPDGQSAALALTLIAIALAVGTLALARVLVQRISSRPAAPKRSS